MKNRKKILFTSLLIIFMLGICTTVYGASASISASKTSVTEGESVTITVKINAAAWGVKVKGDGIDKGIAGANMDEKNSDTVETYTLKTSKPGTYTVTLTGDITDQNAKEGEYDEVNKSVTITAKPKTTSNPTGGNTTTGGTTTKTETKPKVEEKPTFTSTNKTMYTTNECNLRASWSTSSSATTVSKGTELKVTGTSSKSVNGYVWYRVEYKGATKYIASYLLTSSKPVVEKKEEEKKDEKNEENKVVQEIPSEEDILRSEENVDVKKEENNNVDELKLSQLTITGVDFGDEFNPNVYSYELKLNFLVQSLNITAEPNKEDANVEIIGNENFTKGENNVTILLTSSDGAETKTYQIKVIVPDEAATPQNDLNFYLTCGGIILAAIVLISIITIIYNKGKNKYIYGDDDDFEIDRNNLEEKKTRGKHSN